MEGSGPTCTLGEGQEEISQPATCHNKEKEWSVKKKKKKKKKEQGYTLDSADVAVDAEAVIEIKLGPKVAQEPLARGGGGILL